MRLLTVLFILFCLSSIGVAQKRDLNQAVIDIDRLIEKELSKQKLKANANISDDTFLRRIYLDITGRIPTPEEADKFTDDKSKNKRSKLIDSLLKSEGYISDQLNYWSDILRITRDRGHTLDAAAYHLWLRQSIKENKPYDKFVRELVTARDEIWNNGAAAYYTRDRGMPLDNMSNTVRIFLGVRMECAQCHDHPFDDWTQMDYYKMAAFSYGMTTPNVGYGKDSNRAMLNKSIGEQRKKAYEDAVGEGFPYVGNEKNMERYIKKYSKKYLKKNNMTAEQFRKRAQKGLAAANKAHENMYAQRQAVNNLYQPLRNVVSAEDEKRKLKLPHDYQYDDAKPLQVIEPATMFGSKIDLSKTHESKIEAYGNWMVSKKNPNFSKVIANRLWAKVFGVGVINPVDDLAGYNKNSNPELLEYLTKLMKDLNFNMRAYQSVLYKTKAYQREANMNEVQPGQPYYFAGPMLRRMSAEQIWDSLVALSIANADHYHPGITKQQQLVNRAYQMYRSLEDRSLDDYKKMVAELGKVNAKVFKDQQELTTKLNKARVEKDKESYDKYRKELNEVRKGLRNSMNEIAYIHLDDKNSAAPSMSGGMSMMTNSSSNELITKLPKPEKMKAPKDLDKKKRKAWQQKESYEYRDYFKLIARMARASELDQPAPRGHFLRDFGQSDRETIENAAYNASIPQALNLLNGQIIDALANRYSLLGKRLFMAKTPEAKITAIFKAMLTREPTSDEMAMILEDVKKYGERSYRGLIWTLLNTRQFLFIQ